MVCIGTVNRQHNYHAECDARLLIMQRLSFVHHIRAKRLDVVETPSVNDPECALISIDKQIWFSHKH